MFKRFKKNGEILREREREREVENRDDNFFKRKINVLGTVKEKTIRKIEEILKNGNKKKTNKTDTSLYKFFYVFVTL